MVSLATVRAAVFGTVAMSFPAATLVVFGLGADRMWVADVLSWVYSLGIWIGVAASFLPLGSLARWTAFERLESFALCFLAMSFATHLSWELGWLAWRHDIALARDSWWAYSWWAYIDGGDARYASPRGLLVSMERLSVFNGLCGTGALVALARGSPRAVAPVIALVVCAAVHFYSCALYYLSELDAGLPNVATGSFTGLWIKFVLANSPWVVAPPLVWLWAIGRLSRCVDAGRITPARAGTTLFRRRTRVRA